MGQVLWIKDAEASSDSPADDLWALCYFAGELDGLCKDRGVRELSEFHDTSDAAADLGIGVDPVISEPSDLLTTLSTLSSAVSEGAGRFQRSGVDRRADVEAELQNALQVTRTCQEKAQKVRVVLVS